MMDLVEVLKDYDLNGSGTGDVQGNLTNVNYFKEEPVLTWSYLIILVISTIMGNVGNFLIIAAVISYQKLRTKANVFVISLAVADICVATVVQYFSIVGVVLGYTFFLERNWLCHTVASVCQISCAASLLNMIGVAVNRYICICRNAWYHRVYTKKNLTLMVALVWFLAFLIDFPQFWGWGGHAYDQKTMLCSWNRLADLSYAVFFACIIILPSPVILFCYISIFVHVYQSRREIIKIGGRIDKGGESSSNVQLAKTLFIVFMLYMACWVPYALIAVIDVRDEWPKALHLFTIQFAHTNSSINSIIYGLSNPAFRKGYIFVLRKLIDCCIPCCMHKSSPGPSNSFQTSSRQISQISTNTVGRVSRSLSQEGDDRTEVDRFRFGKRSFRKKTGHYEPSEFSLADSMSMCTSISDISVRSLPK